MKTDGGLAVGLAQVDSRLGDMAGNVDRMVAAARVAAQQGADLVIYPELCVCGYPPRDLLLDRAFVADVEAATRHLAARVAGGPSLLVGTVYPGPHLRPGHPNLYNAAALLAGGRVREWRAKRLLPAGDVFHEPRWFLPAPPQGPLDLGSTGNGRAGVLICEDLWDEGYTEHPPAELAARGARWMACLSASPYREGILARRLAQARRTGLPTVFVNAVGAQDELIFDGGSFAMDGRGSLLALLPRFEEAVEVVHLADEGDPSWLPPPEGEEDLFNALVLGVRDFMGKNGLRRAVVGLSGGIDSALVTCVAAEALGPQRVTAISIPSRFTDPQSVEAARDLASRLGVDLVTVELEPLHAAAETSLSSLLGPGCGTTAENLQARLRMVVLMAHVNRHGGILLNTSNKTELSLGYGTLYGDMAGTLAVLGDLTKTDVVAVARWCDRHRRSIPPFILDRAPTAELRPHQVDPFDYPVVAPAVEAMVQGVPPSPLACAQEVRAWGQALDASEHKRWQAGIVLKVSDRAFGSGRMMPVTRHWRQACPPPWEIPPDAEGPPGVEAPAPPSEESRPMTDRHPTTMSWDPPKGRRNRPTRRRTWVDVGVGHRALAGPIPRLEDGGQEERSRRDGCRRASRGDPRTHGRARTPRETGGRAHARARGRQPQAGGGQGGG